MKRSQWVNGFSRLLLSAPEYEEYRDDMDLFEYKGGEITAKKHILEDLIRGLNSSNHEFVSELIKRLNDSGFSFDGDYWGEDIEYKTINSPSSPVRNLLMLRFIDYEKK